MLIAYFTFNLLLLLSLTLFSTILVICLAHAFVVLPVDSRLARCHFEGTRLVGNGSTSSSRTNILSNISSAVVRVSTYCTIIVVSTAEGLLIFILERKERGSRVSSRGGDYRDDAEGDEEVGDVL